MPLPEHLEILARDCDVTPFKSSGPGGQKKNKTESSVRVRHLPSGIVRIATESRSQGRNRDAALGAGVGGAPAAGAEAQAAKNHRTLPRRGGETPLREAASQGDQERPGTPRRGLSEWRSR